MSAAAAAGAERGSLEKDGGRAGKCLRKEPGRKRKNREGYCCCCVVVQAGKAAAGTCAAVAAAAAVAGGAAEADLLLFQRKPCPAVTARNLVSCSLSCPGGFPVM